MTFDNNNKRNISRKNLIRHRRPISFITRHIENEKSPTEDPVKTIPTTLPLLPLRDVSVFNYMIVPLLIGRENSARAVEAAAQSNRQIFLCTQKNPDVEHPTMDNVFHTGTVATILRLIKMPDGHIKALVQGIARAKLLALSAEDPVLIAQIEVLREKEANIPMVEQEALIRFAREQCERILAMRGIPTNEIMNALNSITAPGRIADLIAANLHLNTDDSQTILNCLDPIERLHLVVTHLVREAEVSAMQMKIQSSAREGMDKAQKEYFLREQLRAIKQELGDTDEQYVEELKKNLEEANLPEAARKEADKQLRRLSSMHSDSSEATVVRTYLDWIADLPWDKTSTDCMDIGEARNILEEDHYGLAKIKERILEYLSVRKLNPDSKGSILCFAGPPGVGKTSLGRSIARALGRKFERISLGGMRDEAEIRGHRRTYIGAMPGRIIQSLKNAGTRNPVIMLDEIDKLGNDFRGDPSSALLEALDPEQNINFSDHYLNVPFDLSKVLFICTANHLENIPGALRDRLEIITLSGYTLQEKVAIAKTYLVPRQQKDNGLSDDNIRLSDTVLAKIVSEYTREAGVRTLERQIGSVFRKFALKKAEGLSFSQKVSPANLSAFLGAPRFLQNDRDPVLPIGEALGLAWTPSGGEVLRIEAATMKGKGALSLTGQLGDVMKESAKAAMSYIRAHCEELGIDADFTEKFDIHIHVPDGATPKDGPSAGVTLLTALISQLTDRPVRSDLCMTGEITLHGQVLPVGGIKEKILAGVALGLNHVFIPFKNTKDLEDVPQELLRKITVHTAKNIRDVLDFALTPDTPTQE